MFEDFFPILLILVIATVLALVFTLLSVLFGRRTKLGKKNQSYECGIDPVGSTKDPVPVKFFLVAISFITTRCSISGANSTPLISVLEKIPIIRLSASMTGK